MSEFLAGGDYQVMSVNDDELLQRYVRAGSADDFREIVRRHLDLVYSVARRQTGSPTRAEDVSQHVFIELAQEARHIKPGTP
ncbi:MAG: sigma factor, partial [Opitutaceae bacterium]